MSKRIQHSDLRLADVLLCRGDSQLSDAIVLLDGGQHSHAAVWCGDALVESTLPCVRQSALAEVASHALYIDVYRHRAAAQVASAVAESARRYLSRAYGTLNLSLSTLVIAVCALMPDEWSSLNVLYGAGNLARLLQIVRNAIARVESPQVTCVELVARAFFEGGAPLSIRLRGPGRFDPLLFARAVRSLYERLHTETPQAVESGADAPAVLVDLVWLDELEARIEAGQPAAGAQPIAWRPIRDQWLAALRLPPAAGPPAARSAAPEEVVPQLLELSVPEIRAKALVVGETWIPALLTPQQLGQSPELELIGRIHQR